MEERLQKLLSAAGVCSRRQAEQYLLAGRVTVNGRTASLGSKADPEVDLVAVDGVLAVKPKTFTYLMLHKPRGYVTTLSDEQGRPTAASLVAGCGKRVWPVGRLDYLSEGLLLFTDDGALTNALTHPRHQVEKEYHVRVTGDLARAVPILAGPMELDGQPLRPTRVKKLDGHRLSVTITQGKNRQVRRMCALAGLTVERLVRVREGPLSLGELPPGHWRALTAEEVEAIKTVSGFAG